jgi:hypothetical protein
VVFVLLLLLLLRLVLLWVAAAVPCVVLCCVGRVCLCAVESGCQDVQLLLLLLSKVSGSQGVG